jgi:hypothetical protein
VENETLRPRNRGRSSEEAVADNSVVSMRFLPRTTFANHPGQDGKFLSLRLDD